ncbi:XAC2610-related protein [Chryseobacterium mucoviscidosis]|uniref:Uncharacterized protein n=1 Tax=Chryseobacterium mucoviscidosis TaxID=1945581 RepID=A0A202CDT2_9FLAO|nr:hypothetical protein [Chryseobacterium mucoviscidosis]OVE61858.1 hypothetical protein B0E34_02450 [Chryseobacterium mucoviscidosis]
MHKKIFSILFFFLIFTINAQTVYTGFIGNYPVEMVIYPYGKLADATYSYTNFDEPISLDNGKINNGHLIFQEKENSKKDITTAVLTINNFSKSKDNLEGTWKNTKSNTELKVSLTKQYAFDVGENIEWSGRELLQPVSLGNNYFKIVLTKKKDEYYPKVSAVKIIEKKTDKVLQILNVECQPWGLNSIAVNDYNFDGIMDFSVFESSYAGPNTSSIYFLYDKKSRQYFESGFSGISLEFDQAKKRIYERNQCCAGTVVTTAEYKVVDNNMIILGQHCYRWSEKKHGLVERKLKECR